MTQRSDTALYDPQPLPRAYTSLYAPPPAPPELRESRSADVVVIGMGITGNCAAIELARKGVQVTQLEASDVAAGASGRAFGLVVPYGKHDEARVLKDFGAEAGERYIAAIAGGPAAVRSLIAEFAMPHVLHGQGWVLGPFTPQAAVSLARRAEYWQRRGAEVEFVEGKAIADLIGSDLYPCGLFDRRALTINPLAYCCGLAQAAQRLGAAQYAHSPVIAIERAGQQWRVRTPGGEVTCRQVLLCTDVYSGGLWPGLAANLIRIRGYQAVTEVIGESAWPRILPGAAVVTDTRHTWSGLKKLPDGRLQLSAGGPTLASSKPADLGAVSARLRELYPWLGPVRWDAEWSGWVGLTPKQHPAIRRFADGMWAGLGYSGRGIAAATLMGRELAQLALDPDGHVPMVPIEESKPVRPQAAARMVAAALVTWYRLIDLRSRRAGRG